MSSAEYRSQEFVGVSYEEETGRYWSQHGSGENRKRKVFSVSGNGEREAFFKAVCQRLKWEDEETKKLQQKTAQGWQRLINVLDETDVT